MGDSHVQNWLELTVADGALTSVVLFNTPMMTIRRQNYDCTHHITQLQQKKHQNKYRFCFIDIYITGLCLIVVTVVIVMEFKKR